MEDDLEPFESARLVLSNTKATIDKIEGEVGAFIDDCIGPVREDFDAQTQEKIIFVTLKKPFPDSIRIDTYHVVSDAKHALDQCVGDAAILLGRADAKGLHFPIGKTVTDFDREIKRRLKKVHTGLRDHLVGLDTNERGNPDLYKFLSMSGPNKHQRIVGITAKSNMTISGSHLGMMTGVVLNIGKWHRKKNEIEFIRIRPGGSISGRGHLYDALKPSLRVTFRDGGPPFDEPLPTTLRRFCGECERVFSGIESETEHILRTHL
ncbi:MAG: hypothetical protein VYC38_01015 [Pseudomonadota bacterium]|nr:hypothetical protein [Pseudomonadota bacterium]